MYSAIKVNGKKLYDYARNNEEVDIDMSKLSLDNQISRSSMLELVSRKRKINR